MAVGPNYGLGKGFLATGTAAYSYGQVVKSTTDGKGVAPIAAATDVPRGVVMEDIDAVKVATGKAVIGVMLEGIVRVKSGGAIVADALVKTSADGKSVVAAIAGDWAVGRAMIPASAAGAWIEIHLTPGVKA